MATILTGPRRRIGEIDPSFPIVSSIQPSYEVKTGLEFVD